MFGISEIAILLIVVILVLGAKRLPELARSAGKSARILKAEAKAMKAEGAEGKSDRADMADETGAAPGGSQVIEGKVLPNRSGPEQPGQQQQRS
ncbi:twin-arginine translocase TatA/TatE family subunit [Streptomyces cavernicola]|uniref:Sec-independent protein translocase protein TatA n=1 Tax=Streptomyces cavernicola TaxID=3043613 RepID=A0ABT6S471_9ACTN|nr:twin-arginine translocase TatA/TatE family subunit [Streptomyces sp. B-S-A6]MDI3402903.1 twin-arginine translocase TatA/TatE family subunit [Streptomyces sp. B-S-A6]